MKLSPHRAICIALSVMLDAFAVLQYNDPDPAVWMAVYFGMSALCLWSAFGALPRVVPAVVVVAALIGAYLLWPETYQGLSGKMDSRPGVELARESLGLLICALVAAYLAWRGPVRPFKA
jgi:Transmembrane family 220, helix